MLLKLFLNGKPDIKYILEYTVNLFDKRLLHFAAKFLMVGGTWY